MVWSFPVIDGYCSRCWSAVDAFSVGILDVGDVRDDKAHDSVVVCDPGIREQPVPVEGCKSLVSQLPQVKYFACKVET